MTKKYQKAMSSLQKKLGNFPVSGLTAGMIDTKNGVINISMPKQSKKHIHEKGCSWKQFNGKSETCDCRARKRAEKRQSKQAHTPTPWYIGHAKGKETHTYIASNDERIVIDIGHVSNDDASFIVRACNSHEDLLKASKQALFIFRQIPTKDMAYSPETMKKLEQAIAKAEGN